MSLKRKREDDISLKLPIISDSTKPTLTIEQAENILLSGFDFKAQNFSASSVSLNIINPQQTSFSGANISTNYAKFYTNLNNKSTQTQQIIAIDNNDNKCTYSNIKNIINVYLKCSHAKCHYRKLSQKIDKIIENKDNSAYTMQQATNSIYRLLKDQDR